MTANKVLLVDDSITARKLLLKLCRNSGLETVIEAERANEALVRLIVEDHFSLIICDWNMPGVNGFDLLMNVKNNPQTRDIPFIFVTAESESQHIRAAKELGAIEYLIKPINPQAFYEMVQRVLGPQNAAA